MTDLTDNLGQINRWLKLNELDQNPNFSFIQKKSGIKPSGFVIAILVFLVIVTVISNATSLVIGVSCCCVPAYFTFVQLQNNNSTLIKKYLIYWIFYAILQTISFLIVFLLPPTIYILIRIAITVALLHPDSDLALRIYGQLIQPFLRQYQKQIDINIENAVEKGKEGIKKGKQLIQKQLFQKMKD